MSKTIPTFRPCTMLFSETTIKQVLQHIKLMVMCPTQTLTHQLQPGIRYQHLVLLVLKTEVEERQKESEIFFYIRAKNQSNSYLINWKMPL